MTPGENSGMKKGTPWDQNLCRLTLLLRTAHWLVLGSRPVARKHQSEEQKLVAERS